MDEQNTNIEWLKQRDVHFNIIKKHINLCESIEELNLMLSVIEIHYDTFKSPTLEEQLLKHYCNKQNEIVTKN